MPKNKVKELTVRIDLTKQKEFEMMHSILNAMLNDKRIPKHIREEYLFMEMSLYN